ncbi:hypothetical protein [Tautonia sociabilis]|uniref:TIGR03067 domain-containing protein n=1 Tax=Tautonia sociabilis TaxID=2080755 RepID=A0A432MEM3_9BACT|nr:hypothetical protein [Tautonia sociabilis]RUL83968.1 hypothetical protein TsocGM_21340 [Tautonia sociabilis]
MLPLLLMTAASALPPADDPADALAPLQGSWRAEAGPTGEVIVTLTINGDRFEQVVATAPGVEFTFRGRLLADDSSDPGRLDWIEVVGPDGEAIPDAPARYRLDGDTLTVCTAAPGGGLPDTLAAGRGRYPSLRVYHRRQEEQAVDGDLLAMQGEWSGAVGPNGLLRASLSIQGRSARFVLLGPDGQEVFSASGLVRLDETVTPRAMDWIPDDGQSDRPVLSIYELDGSSLRICLGIARRDGPTPRPEAFTEDVRTITLSRKPEQAPSDPGDPPGSDG